AANVTRGSYIRSEPSKTGTDIAIDATVLHAVMRNPDQPDITIDDLHQKKRSGKISNLILFVVDASGSMAAGKRMEAVKGTVLSLLTDAYQKRDTVGVIAFRGIEAQILLNPTQSIELAEEAMRNLPTGGRTPLPHALQTAIRVLYQFDLKKGYNPILVILTDGKANVALPGEGDPWGQTMALSAQLKSAGIQSLVLNSDANYLNLGRAEELSQALGAQYLSLNDISEEKLTPIINKALA
ncbi:MAG TPA: VWA domain-containing protein, partial [Pedobacter sp.]